MNPLLIILGLMFAQTVIAAILNPLEWWAYLFFYGRSPMDRLCSVATWVWLVASVAFVVLGIQKLIA